MKVLHVWNTAGVASVLAKYQKSLLGWDSFVLARKSIDAFRQLEHGSYVSGGPELFYITVLKEARKYDIIHVHDADKLIPILKKVYKNKLIVLHYHGDTIRKSWLQKKKYWSHADVVLVSTEDLLEDAPSHVIYLPNPVDTSIFKPLPHIRKEKTAVYLYSNEPKLNKGLKRAIEYAKNNNYKLIVWDRFKKPIPYKLMPRFLNIFEVFIDHNWVPAYSKTALEALACGLKVLRWDDKLVVGLPSIHRPEKVVIKLAKIYLNHL